MELQQIKRNIAAKYKENSDKIKHPPNKRLIQTLEEQLTNEEQETGQFNIVFRGNYKFNFNSRLSDKDVILLCETLIDYGQDIRNIDLSFNLISNAGAESLAQLLNYTGNLESLNVQGNRIETVGGQQIAESLKDNENVRYLNFSGNRIETNGTISVIDFLFSKQNLVELNLADNGITHDGIIGLTSVLNWNNNTLQVLNVDKPIYSSIGQETAIHFAKMLQSNRSLKKLSLQKHGFTCDAIYTITEHLLENNKLRVLDLTANKISYKGCESLAKYLCGEYCTLESLILKNNRTGHYGAKAIAQALSKNRTLVHVDMTHNSIDDNGLKMIAEALETNDILVFLKLYYNDFGQQSLQAFHKLSQKPRKNGWDWDFYTYIVDDHVEMAFVENEITYDVTVSEPYYL